MKNANNKPANIGDPLEMDNDPIPFKLTGRKAPKKAIVNELTGFTVAEVLADYEAKNPQETRSAVEPKVIRSGLTREEALEGLTQLHNLLTEDDDVHPAIIAGRVLVACVGDADDAEAPYRWALKSGSRPTPKAVGLGRI